MKTTRFRLVRGLNTGRFRWKPGDFLCDITHPENMTADQAINLIRNAIAKPDPTYVAPKPAAEPEEETPSPPPPNATDAAKALAAECGVDLALVTGTGADGQITKPDVKSYIASDEVAA
jgi:pyruvate/2-oxoglutarate dehydrogenase complex dihydrolipoamide acyltransferase (E2) component